MVVERNLHQLVQYGYIVRVINLCSSQKQFNQQDTWRWVYFSEEPLYVVYCWVCPGNFPEHIWHWKVVYRAVTFFNGRLSAKMNMSFVNGGDKMAKLILLYLIFAGSYNYFVLYKQKYIDADKQKFKNLLSNLAALSIMLQLCLAYFSSGVAKINEPLWQHGEATYYALSMERFMGTSFNKYFVQHRWIDYFTNYATMCFELFFPLLIWIKKIRKPLLITGILFHLCIYIFLMIYGFQIVFVLIYGLFLPNQKLLNFAQKCKALFWQKKTNTVADIA